jgi:hypothetical protein
LGQRLKRSPPAFQAENPVRSVYHIGRHASMKSAEQKADKEPLGRGGDLLRVAAEFPKARERRR